MLEWLTSIEPQVAASRWSAWWFLPFAVPISIYIAWTDLKAMRIPNKAVLLLFGCFLVAGLIALPLPDYGWRIVQAAAVLAVGFFLNQFGGVGAGDVKFAAAAAPLVAPDDARMIMILFASVLLAAFATHRGFRALPFTRRVAPEWQSWTRQDFPMGLALGGALIFYLVLAVIYGV